MPAFHRTVGKSTVWKGNPMHIKTWDVQVLISEEDNITKARAVLISDSGSVPLHGEGTARLHPHEPAVPEIGAEIAAARALSALGTALLDTALDDIRGVVPLT
jgi:hypothetical protein